MLNGPGGTAARGDNELCGQQPSVHGDQGRDGMWFANARRCANVMHDACCSMAYSWAIRRDVSSATGLPLALSGLATDSLVELYTVINSKDQPR